VIDHDEHAIDVDMVENMIANIIQQNTNSEN
jgi:20S proteasome alpha/beta subunit